MSDEQPALTAVVEALERLAVGDKRERTLDETGELIRMEQAAACGDDRYRTESGEWARRMRAEHSDVRPDELRRTRHRLIARGAW